VHLHYPREPLADGDVRRAHGLPTTSVERTILDSLESGTQPEQIELAVQQAVDRALTTPKRLREAAAARAATTRSFIERALGE
jgi:hypothetical protein